MNYRFPLLLYLLTSSIFAPLAEALDQIRKGIKIPNAIETEPPPEVYQLEKQYLEAVLAQDCKQLSSLWHSVVVKCIEPSTQFYFDDKCTRIFARYQSSTGKPRINQFLILPTNYEIPDGFKALLERQSVFIPIQPTHLVEIVRETKATHRTFDPLYLRKEKGKFYIVEGCPVSSRLDETRKQIAKEEWG